MKHFKKGFILLTVLICVSLAACGENAAVSDGEIAGGDWRTTGIVRDSGSIARGSEVTEVLICVHKEDAAFYYDKSEQVTKSEIRILAGLVKLFLASHWCTIREKKKRRIANASSSST